MKRFTKVALSAGAILALALPSAAYAGKGKAKPGAPTTPKPAKPPKPPKFPLVKI